MNEILDQLPHPPEREATEKSENLVGSYIAAGVGAFLAAFVDLLQNGGEVGSRNALVLRISDVIKNHFHPELGAGLYAVMVVIAAGLLLCWLWSPSTRRDAFALGLSVFALFSAASPYSEAEKTGKASTITTSAVKNMLIPIANAEPEMELEDSAQLDYLLNFKFRDRNAVRSEIRIEIIDRSRSTPPQTLIVPSTQPLHLRLRKGRYVILAECDGCARSRILLDVRKPIEASEIEFASSNWPLSLQRLTAPRVVTTRDLSEHQARAMLDRANEKMGVGMRSPDQSNH